MIDNATLHFIRLIIITDKHFSRISRFKNLLTLIMRQSILLHPNVAHSLTLPETLDDLLGQKDCCSLPGGVNDVSFTKRISFYG